MLDTTTMFNVVLCYLHMYYVWNQPNRNLSLLLRQEAVAMLIFDHDSMYVFPTMSNVILILPAYSRLLIFFVSNWLKGLWEIMWGSLIKSFIEKKKNPEVKT